MKVVLHNIHQPAGYRSTIAPKGAKNKKGGVDEELAFLLYELEPPDLAFGQNS